MQSRRIIPDLTKQDVERFLQFTSESNSGCHEWRGSLNENGYGHFTLHGKTFRAHRVAFAIKCGSDPAEMFVCHSCDNRSCVNPDHLWLGTAKDNTQDMLAKGRHSNGVRNAENCVRCGHLRQDDIVDRNNARRCRNCMKIRDEARKQARLALQACI